jgi:hypothetical protein
MVQVILFLSKWVFQRYDYLVSFKTILLVIIKNKKPPQEMWQLWLGFQRFSLRVF